MSRVPIPNQKYFVLMTMHQALQEFTYLIGSDRAFNDHKLHLSPRRYGRHHVQSKTGSCTFNNGCLTLQGPSGSRMKIRSDSRLIVKINRGPFFLGTLLDFWENVLFPLFHQLRTATLPVSIPLSNPFQLNLLQENMDLKRKIILRWTLQPKENCQRLNSLHLVIP